MTDAKQVRGHSRKLKIGVGGQQPVVSTILKVDEPDSSGPGCSKSD